MNVIDFIAIVPYFVTLLLMVSEKPNAAKTTTATMGNASFTLQGEKQTQVISMALLRYEWYLLFYFFGKIINDLQNPCLNPLL